MKITAYNNAINSSNKLKEQKESEKKSISNKKNENIAESSKDSVDDMLDVSLDISKIDAIRAKIQNGYYNDPGIIKDVAAKLLREIGEL